VDDYRSLEARRSRHAGFPKTNPATLEHAFGTGDLAGPAGINFGSHAHGAGKGFEGGFDDVVGVKAVELANVQGHLAVIDHGDKELSHQLGVVGADPLGGNCQAVAEVGTTGKVERDLNERFIQRGDKVAEPDNAFAIAQCLLQGHP